MYKSNFVSIAIVALIVILLYSISFLFQDAWSLEIPSNVSLTTPRSDRITFDDNGIPLVDYGNGIGKQRNPLTVAKTAEYNYQKFTKTGDVKFKQNFFNNVNWLVSNAKLVSNPGMSYMVLESKFPFRQNIYHLTPPWISAMAHAEALPPLYEGYALTKNKTYIDTASLILNSFYVMTCDGGATVKLPDNRGWWYEEYPSPFPGGSRVLNGMMFSVLNIYKYYNYTNDPAAKYLFDQGVIALKNELPKYDFKNGTWSFYDFYPGQLAVIKYHKVHIMLSGELYKITHDDIFNEYGHKWLQSLIANNS